VNSGCLTDNPLYIRAGLSRANVARQVKKKKETETKHQQLEQTPAFWFYKKKTGIRVLDRAGS